MRQSLEKTRCDGKFFTITWTSYNGKCVPLQLRKLRGNSEFSLLSALWGWCSHFPEVLWKSLPLLFMVCNVMFVRGFSTIFYKVFLACGLTGDLSMLLSMCYSGCLNKGKTL